MGQSKTDHPYAFARLTEAQRDALALIAINQPPSATRSTLEALVRRGLVEKVARQLPGWPSVTIEDYEMPLAVHIHWCSWCSQNYLDNE